MPEKYKKITNHNFDKFLCAVSQLFEIEKRDILSCLKDASLDDSNGVYLYDGSVIDMDTIKLDDITVHFSKYMKEDHKLKKFEQPSAVDAICIDKIIIGFS